MQLTTPVDLPEKGAQINHRSKILLLGSCFAQNIGLKLRNLKFDICMAPFGTVYNPLSVAAQLKRAWSGEAFTEDSPELFEHNGHWHSFLHHGDFSRNTKPELLHTTNSALGNAHNQIRNADTIILTFGTAYAYLLATDGSIVSNCHKLPARMFERRLLGIDETVRAMSDTLEPIIAARPNVNIILTVSPIRHLRDGAHDNQKSKATLLLAVDELQKAFPCHCDYFPAYEIMLDELRDYRFYAEDMLHPSPTAVEYIWQKFSECHMGNECHELCSKIEEINRALAHRPFDETSEAHKKFLHGTKQKIIAVNEQHPYIDFEKELERCNIPLNK